MGGSKSATIGYKYFLSMHLGVCMGPVDALLAILAGERLAWSGSQTVSGSIVVKAPELFGGDEKEGGIKGLVDVMMGEEAQAVNAHLLLHQGAPQPAYRGFLGLVFRGFIDDEDYEDATNPADIPSPGTILPTARGGLISSNNPYVKAWALKVRRVLQGWQSGGVAWYPERAPITLSTGDIAANPAHIVYECLTNIEWGMGTPPGQLDDASFRAAADAFFSEGLGLCIKWTKQEVIESFLQVVLNHAGALLGVDARTGLFVLKAIRGDYVVASLPSFGPDEISTLDNYTRPGIVSAVNEIIATYVDVTNGKEGSVTVQNLANITSQGGIVTSTKSYAGLPTAALAQRCALRDLRAISSPLAKVRFRVNRKAYSLKPGDVFRFSWPKLGLTNVVMRVLRATSGTLTSGEIAIEAAEDVFGMPAATYLGQQPSGWVEPNNEPAPITLAVLQEAPLWELARAADVEGGGAAIEEALSFINDGDGYLWALAARPTPDAQNYRLMTLQSGDPRYRDAALGNFCPNAELNVALTFSSIATVLAPFLDAELVRSGRFALIEQEIVRVVSFNFTSGALTIARGVLDTVAKPHAIGSRIYFAQEYAASDQVRRLDGETVSTKMLTRTGRGLLALEAAPVLSMTYDRRAMRPYPPGRLRINGEAYPAGALDSITVQWAHRNRLNQNLEGDDVGDITPEVGQTYSLELRSMPSMTLISSQVGITANTATIVPTAEGVVRLIVWSVRAGFESRQRHEHDFIFSRTTATGWDRGWSRRWGAGLVEINLRSAFEVQRGVVGYSVDPFRAILSGGDHIDYMTKRLASGVVRQAAYGYRFASADYDASSGVMAVANYTQPGDAASIVPRVVLFNAAGSLTGSGLVGPGGSGEALLITPSESTANNPIVAAAAAGFVYTLNYPRTILRKFNITTGALVATRTEPGGFGGSVGQSFAADADHVILSTAAGVVTVLSAADLSTVTTFTLGGGVITGTGMPAATIIDGEILAVRADSNAGGATRRLYRHTKAGAAVANYVTDNMDVVRQFGRYVSVIGSIGLEPAQTNYVFDRLNSWTRVFNTGYVPP